jgi:outer membrane protein assembly factor BamB
VPVPRPGFSSPVVWDGRIYLTGADREVPAEVYCFDAGTGTLLWRHAATDIAASPQELPDVTEDTGYAAPTPATDGERVCALFATGDLVCLAPDGERLWARNLGVPDNHYGHASSLLLDRGTLLVQYDHFGGSRLLGIDPQTGETRFQTARPDVQISWASPLLARAEGRRTLVLAAAPLVAGYDPATGAELWRAEVLSGEVGPSPAYAAGRVFVANQYAQAAAIRLGGRGDVSETHVLWTGMDHLPDVASPVATAEHLFLATSAGILACLDAATGEVRWTHETEKGFWASPILAGDRLYALDRGGRMHIALAAGTFTPIATPSLAAETVCTPAFLEGRIYVRTTEELICIGDGDE